MYITCDELTENVNFFALFELKNKEKKKRTH